MADNVTIQLNMTNGEIHIQAPAESLDTIFDKLEAFLPKLAGIRTEYVPDKADSITVGEDNHSASAAEKSEHIDVLSKNSTKRKRNAGKNSVTKDEIYTALRTVEAKIPARISSVLSNLGIEGKITGDADGYRIHHTGEDFVKFNLPKKEG